MRFSESARGVLKNVSFTIGEFIIRLDQEPAIALLPGTLFQPNQMPRSVQFVSLKFEAEMAFLHTRSRIPFRLPYPLVPDDHGAGAILTLRDRAFKGGVIERVIFNMDCEPSLGRVKARPAGNRPTPQHAVMFEAKIIVQSRGVMLVDDKYPAARRRPRTAAGST